MNKTLLATINRMIAPAEDNDDDEAADDQVMHVQVVVHLSLVCLLKILLGQAKVVTCCQAMVLSELYRLEDLLSLVWLGQARVVTGCYRLVALLSLECKLKL